MVVLNKEDSNFIAQRFEEEIKMLKAQNKKDWAALSLLINKDPEAIKVARTMVNAADADISVDALVEEMSKRLKEGIFQRDKDITILEHCIDIVSNGSEE